MAVAVAVVVVVEGDAGKEGCYYYYCDILKDQEEKEVEQEKELMEQGRIELFVVPLSLPLSLGTAPAVTPC